MADAVPAMVLDALPGAVVAVDLEHRIIAWNCGAERLFGWSAGEVRGRKLLASRLRDAHLQRQLDGADHGELVEVFLTRQHRDGRTMDVGIRYSALRAPDGSMQGWVATCRDASEAVRTEGRLRRSQTELGLQRQLAGLVRGMLANLDLDRVLFLVVEAGVQLARAGGGSLSRLTDHGSWMKGVSVHFPDSLEAEQVEVGRGLNALAMAQGEPVVVDDYDSWPEALPESRGQGFSAAVAVPIFRRPGVVAGALAVHATEAGRTFRAEEVDILVMLAQYATIAIANADSYQRIARERGRFLGLVEAIPDGLAVVEGGRVTAWNAAAARLTGRPSDEVIGEIPPLDLDAAAAGVELTGQDGRRRWLETVASPLPDAAGAVYLMRDMTEQHDLDRAKNLFFAATSHELKTPLTVIKGLASTLLAHSERMSPDERHEAHEIIHRRSENLHRLIEQILVGSRLKERTSTFPAGPLDLAVLVHETVSGFAGASARHVVVTEVPERLPLAAGDREAVETILGHLIDNAVKYSPDGGDVVVAVLSETETEAGRLVVEVRDVGVGIEGDLANLLEPFVQDDSGTTRRFGGVGLGLYIVDQLVRGLDGELWAEPRPGGGSTFAFSLPLWF